MSHRITYQIIENIFYSTFEANKKAKFIFCSSSQIFKKKIGFVSEKSKIYSTTDYVKFRIKSDLMMLKYKNACLYSPVRRWNRGIIKRRA